MPGSSAGAGSISSAAATATVAPAERSTRGLVGVLAFSGLAASLVQTLVVPLLPRLPAELHTSPAAVSWLVTATLIVGAISIPLLGRLGDQFGKRRMVLVALCLLVIGSVVCGLSHHIGMLIVGRCLQGASIAVIPLNISVVGTTLPPERRGGGIALISATLGVGSAAGLPLSGLIVQEFDYHALFWVCAAAGVIALVAVWLVVPPSGESQRGRVDLIGAALLAAVLTAFLLPLAQGGTWGWTSPITLCCFAIAAVALVSFIRYELRQSAPLVDIRVSRRRPVLLTNAASVMVGFSLFSSFLANMSLVQAPRESGYGFGATLLVAGLTLLPGGLVMALLSPVSAWLTAWRGAKTTLMAGAGVIAVGYVLLTLLHDALWQVTVGGSVVATGTGLAYAAMPSLILDATPASEAAAANGLNTLARSIGMSVSSAICGALLAAITVHVGGVTMPAETAFVVFYVMGGITALLAVTITAFVPSARRGLSTS